MNHTADCEAARAGHTVEDKDAWGNVVDLRPDPYPLLRDLTEDQRAAVFACPHRSHDVVRVFCQVTLP